MKYPRTYHFSFSPEIHSDDKIISRDTIFENEEIVITEKIDGGNCCLHQGNVFARTDSEVTIHPSFSMTKSLYSKIFYTKDFDFNRYMLYGENVQAIHSIIYSNLRTSFYLFGIFDTKEQEWLSWDDVVSIGTYLGLNVASVIFRGKMDVKQLKEFLKTELIKESFYGGQREGFVVRKITSFKELSENVGKFVRSGHVQSDEHWSKNWKPQKIINSTGN